MINLYGLFLLILLAAPNIVYLQKSKNNGAEDKLHKITSAEITEQIGRYGCIIFTLINTGLYEYGFVSSSATAVWIGVTAALLAAYYSFWILLFKKGNTERYRIMLAVIPGILFIFGGVMMRRLILTFFGILFAVAHTYITYRKGANKE